MNHFPIESMTVDQRATIFVVDDDPGVGRVLNSVGELLDLPVKWFSSADTFLSQYDAALPGCLVLDIRMPGMTGLELQKKMLHDQSPLPVIMISGHADVPITVEVMSRGAVTLLEKPFRLDELTAQIRRAIQLDAARRADLTRQTKTQLRLATLTNKEREVFDLVADGRTNKQIASALQLSVRAVEDRRSRLMRKLGARTVVDLVQWRIA